MLLAVLFGVTFVGFGVGSNVPGGVADLLGRSAGGTGQVDVGEARDRVRENPRDADAQRDLATGLVQRGDVEAAITPLEAYVALKPNDQNALRELASLYLARAGRLRNEAQIAQIQQIEAAPGRAFGPPPTSPFAQALGQPPLTSAVSSSYDERLTTAFNAMSAAYEEAKDAYARVARLNPDDPDVQLQLASAAESAGDTQAAIAAYEKFLKIAPDHGSAPLVREQLKQLRTPASPANAAG